MADEIEEKEPSKIMPLIAGLFVLLSLVGTTYLISNPENTFFCNESNIVGLCNKLDISGTRCYFNESNARQYKYCKSGWEQYKETNVTGIPANLTTYFEIKPFVMKTDFDELKVAEDYINDIKSKLSSEVQITKILQKPYSTEIDVYWKITLYTISQTISPLCYEEGLCIDTKQISKNIIRTEELYSTFQANVSKVEVNETISRNAQEYTERWAPNIEIEVAQ